MATVRKKNISGVDLEVAVLNSAVVKAGDTAELPTEYPWSTAEDPAPIVWPEALWGDDAPVAKPSSKPETE